MLATTAGYVPAPGTLETDAYRMAREAMEALRK